MIGGLIMTHGDDSGLILPPSVAPYQVVIVPIPPRKGDWNEAVLPQAREVQARLRAAGVRVHLDDRDTQQPGFKYADWEMRGVPLRLEIGPKDIEKQQCVLVRRDTREKAFVPLAGLAARCASAWTRSSATCSSGRGGSWPTTRPASPATTSSSRSWPASAASWWRAGAATRPARRASRRRRRPPCARSRSTAEPSPGACVRCGQPSRSEVYFAQAY